MALAGHHGPRKYVFNVFGVPKKSPLHGTPSSEVVKIENLESLFVRGGVGLGVSRRASQRYLDCSSRVTRQRTPHASHLPPSRPVSGMVCEADDKWSWNSLGKYSDGTLGLRYRLCRANEYSGPGNARAHAESVCERATSA